MFRGNSLKTDSTVYALGAWIMKAWRTMNIGAFLIILGLDLVLVFGGVVAGGLFLPIILAVYGVWLIAFALLKQLAKPSIYEYPPLMVGGWGILIGGTGFLWLLGIQTSGQFQALGLGVFIVVVGVLIVAYSLVKK